MKNGMRIAVIGAGAMGALFGALLSARNEVTLYDVYEPRVRAIAQNGVTVREPDGTERCFAPRARLCAEAMEPVELVLLFVKATASRTALAGCRALLGEETTLLTLQNGAGHDEVLRVFLPESQIALGVTQHNASVLADGVIHHGGGGHTYIGRIRGTGDAGASASVAVASDLVSPASVASAPVLASPDPTLSRIASVFTACGFDTAALPDIRPAIWEKLLMNASSSAMTGVLQARQGLCVDSDAARILLGILIREAVAVAAAEGVSFDADAEIAKIEGRLRNARRGLPSIAADIRDGRMTEAETITGAVVRMAHAHGVPAPTHETMLLLLHALEDRARSQELSDI